MMRRINPKEHKNNKKLYNIKRYNSSYDLDGNLLKFKNNNSFNERNS